MALLAHQKISYVLPGKPHGRGTLGAFSSATAPTMTKDSCSGTAASTAFATAGSTFANGDLIQIVQMRGTGVGQWEVALIVSGGGTASLTLSKPLVYTYTDSGSSQAQAIKINEYTDVIIQTGTWSPAAWDGNVGGGLIFAAKGTITPTGTISANALGYVGGAQFQCTNNTDTAFCGEGTVGASVRKNSSDTSANGNSGGAGMRGATGNKNGAGGGASYGSVGTDGGGDSPRQGLVGNTVGVNTLQTLFMGGSGGGGVFDNTGGTGFGGNGGNGAGFVVIYAKRITTINSIVANGDNGQNWSGTAQNTGGGAGAGGSVLICASIVDIGTDKISVIGGTGGTSREGVFGGNGGKGRVAVYYGAAISGSLSASLYGSYLSEQDSSLNEVGGAGLLGFFL